MVPNPEGIAHKTAEEPADNPTAATGVLASGGPIVFYDGDCGLCSRMVRRLLRIDRGRRLRFASLQGQTAESVVAPAARREGRDLLSGMALSRTVQGKTVLEFDSDAALGCVEEAGGAWRVFRVLRIIPRSWRDAAYRWVVERRHRLFGSADSCPLPESTDRARFLP